MKVDYDKDGPDEAGMRGAMKADVWSGVWTMVRLESVGDTMLGQAGGAAAVGKHERTSKTNPGLTAAEKIASFRRLRVWSAKLNPVVRRGEGLTTARRTMGACPPAQTAHLPAAAHEHGSQRRPLPAAKGACPHPNPSD